MMKKSYFIPVDFKDTMINNRFFLLLIFALPSGIYGMESSPASRCENVDRFFIDPVSSIPKYVYENCNQVTVYSWNDEMFQRLKKNVAKATREKLSRLYTNKKEFVKNAEGYDWIHGLNYLEAEYLKAGRDLTQHLTVEEVKKINGLFSRLIADEPGEFREHDIQWIKRPLSNAENMFYLFLADTNKNELLAGDNFYNLRCDVNTNVDANSTRRLLSACKKNRSLVSKTSDILYNTDNSEFNVAELDDWLREQSTLVEEKKKKKNQLNVSDWLEKRCHFFPKAEMIATELSAALEKIKDPAMHPIEKAAYVWFELVRIHISHEANKRTGKALASVILLQNGYLPPLITAEDEKRYIDTFIKNFDSENGFEQFLDFVIDMIVKTQKRFEHMKVS